ncbi:MAG: EamA family transporter, partial [Glaciecola sp.]
MSSLQKWIYTLIAMCAFAGNSVLCRWALVDTDIDPASFTTIRLVSGALFLALLTLVIKPKFIQYPDSSSPTAQGFSRLSGSWLGALALFMYAACFSFAYISLSAATGALILFGSVQFTMILYSIFKGQRLNVWQVIGFTMALIGLGILFLPSATAPDLLGGGLMMLAGVAWGAYSIMGKTAG